MAESDGFCPWEVLGVSPTDDPATIRAAWRALVRSYHPDLAQADREGANRRLAEINAAFDAVSDPEAARRKMKELRAEAASRAEAAKADAERRANAAPAAAKARRSAEDRRASEPPAAPSRMPVVRPHGWSPADLLAAQAARTAFDRALRVFEGRSTSQTRAVYL